MDFDHRPPPVPIYFHREPTPKIVLLILLLVALGALFMVFGIILLGILKG
jgi:hypothetical protein